MDSFLLSHHLVRNCIINDWLCSSVAIWPADIRLASDCTQRFKVTFNQCFHVRVTSVSAGRFKSVCLLLVLCTLSCHSFVLLFLLVVVYSYCSVYLRLDFCLDNVYIYKYWRWRTPITVIKYIYIIIADLLVDLLGVYLGILSDNKACYHRPTCFTALLEIT